MYEWPDLRKLNVNEWMRRKSCRDEKWPKLRCLRSLHFLCDIIDISKHLLWIP